MGETEGRTSIHFSRTAIALERQRIQLTIHWMELQFSRVSTGGASSCLHRLKKHFQSVLQNESISLLNSGVCHDSGNYMRFFDTEKKALSTLLFFSLPRPARNWFSPFPLSFFQRRARLKEEKRRGGRALWKKTKAVTFRRCKTPVFSTSPRLCNMLRRPDFFSLFFRHFQGKPRLGCLFSHLPVSRESNAYIELTTYT